MDSKLNLGKSELFEVFGSREISISVPSDNSFYKEIIQNSNCASLDLFRSLVDMFRDISDVRCLENSVVITYSDNIDRVTMKDSIEYVYSMLRSEETTKLMFEIPIERFLVLNCEKLINNWNGLGDYIKFKVEDYIKSENLLPNNFSNLFVISFNNCLKDLSSASIGATYLSEGESKKLIKNLYNHLLVLSNNFEMNHKIVYDITTKKDRIVNLISESLSSLNLIFSKYEFFVNELYEGRLRKMFDVCVNILSLMLSNTDLAFVRLKELKYDSSLDIV